MSNGNGWQKIWAGTVSGVLVALVGAMIYLGAGLSERIAREHAEIRSELSAIRERLAVLEAKVDLNRGPSQSAGNGGR